MSDRKLVVLPVLLLILCAVLPLPGPRPVPADMAGCFGCDMPVWISEPAHMLVGIPLFLLTILGISKLVLVLLLGTLPDSHIFRTAVPVLWVVFFLSVTYYLVQAVVYAIPLIAYDFTSLIPYLGFAVVDFMFAARLRKRRPPATHGHQQTPFVELPN